MNIVWFIGNGFDIGCGLDTRYPNFYDSKYVQENVDNIIYQDIKNNRGSWEDIDSWADFELQLGNRCNAFGIR